MWDRYGIFGRYAAGAGRGDDERWKRLRALAPDDVARSEQLAGLALRAWERDDSDPETRVKVAARRKERARPARQAQRR